MNKLIGVKSKASKQSLLVTLIAVLGAVALTFTLSTPAFAQTEPEEEIFWEVEEAPSIDGGNASSGSSQDSGNNNQPTDSKSDSKSDQDKSNQSSKTSKPSNKSSGSSGLGSSSSSSGSTGSSSSSSSSSSNRRPSQSNNSRSNANAQAEAEAAAQAQAEAEAKAQAEAEALAAEEESRLAAEEASRAAAEAEKAEAERLERERKVQEEALAAKEASETSAALLGIDTEDGVKPIGWGSNHPDYWWTATWVPFVLGGVVGALLGSLIAFLATRAYYHKRLRALQGDSTGLNQTDMYVAPLVSDVPEVEDEVDPQEPYLQQDNSALSGSDETVVMADSQGTEDIQLDEKNDGEKPRDKINKPVNELDDTLNMDGFSDLLKERRNK